MILLANFLTDFFTGVDPVRLIDFFCRLLISCATLFILIRFIYYPNNGQHEILFTYFLAGLIVFLVASSLDRVEMEFGFALGSFCHFQHHPISNSATGYKRNDLSFCIHRNFGNQCSG